MRMTGTRIDDSQFIMSSRDAVGIELWDDVILKHQVGELYILWRGEHHGYSGILISVEIACAIPGVGEDVDLSG